MTPDIEKLALEVAIDVYGLDANNRAVRVPALEFASRLIAAYNKECGEPVRWMCPDFGDVSKVQRVGWMPLYTHPTIPEGMVLVSEEDAKATDMLRWILHNPMAFEDIFEEVFYESGTAGANDEMRSVVLSRIDAARKEQVK